MEKESSEAMLMKTKSSETGDMFMKRKSSGTGAVSFSRLRSLALNSC